MRPYASRHDTPITLTLSNFFELLGQKSCRTKVPEFLELRNARPATGIQTSKKTKELPPGPRPQIPLKILKY